VTGVRLARRCLALLGPLSGPVAVAGPGTSRLRAALGAEVAVARDDAPAAAAVVSFWGAAARPEDRRAVLLGVARRLPGGAPLVLVDHNQPRAVWRRAAALPALLLAGVGPARARYPAAREMQAFGFVVERLRLADGERMQLVVGRRRQ
jgi:hypothetical protein